MRDALKNLFTKEVTLEDGTSFSYAISPYEMKNVLGKAVDHLSEYSFVEKNNESPFTCKLYKTKDNSWYDLVESRSALENNIVRKLKATVDGEELLHLSNSNAINSI